MNSTNRILEIKKSVTKEMQLELKKLIIERIQLETNQAEKIKLTQLLESCETWGESLNKPKEQENILEAAIEYVNCGFSIVRMLPEEKRVYGRWAEYQQRQPTEEEIKGWFKVPYFQVGVICGPVSGGFFGLDFDGSNWEDHVLEFTNQFPKFQDTRIVVTGSGKIHLWGRCPDLKTICDEMNWKSKIVRTFGERTPLGQDAVELMLRRWAMIAPPSRHPSGEKYSFFNTNDPIQIFSVEEMRDIIAWFNQGKAKATTAPTVEALILTVTQKIDLQTSILTWH